MEVYTCVIENFEFQNNFNAFAFKKKITLFFEQHVVLIMVLS